MLKRRPNKSDQQIGKEVDASPSTVGTVRKKLEAAGDVSKLDTRTDVRGRRQPAHKPKNATRPVPKVIPVTITSEPREPIRVAIQITSEPRRDLGAIAVVSADDRHRRTPAPASSNDIRSAADLRDSPALPTITRLGLALDRLRAIQQQVEAEPLPLDLLSSDERRWQIKEIWANATVRLTDAVLLVEADRDEQRAAEAASALKTTTSAADGSHRPLGLLDLCVEIDLAIARQARLNRTPNNADGKWLGKFIGALRKYENGESSRDPAPVLKAWQNLTPVDPVKFVIGKNLTRRDLTLGQRSYAMAQFATYTGGRPNDVQTRNKVPGLQSNSEPIYTIEQAAALADSSTKYIQYGKIVWHEGTTDEFARPNCRGGEGERPRRQGGGDRRRIAGT